MPVSRSSRPETAPGERPSVTPREVGYDHSLLLQAIMENQRTLGEVKEGVAHLKIQADAQSKTLNRHGYMIAWASGGVTVAILMGSFLLNKIWDKLSTLVTLKIPQ